MIEISGYMDGKRIASFLCTTNSTIEAMRRFNQHCKEADKCLSFFRPLDETDPKNLPLIKTYMANQAII